MISDMKLSFPQQNTDTYLVISWEIRLFNFLVLTKSELMAVKLYLSVENDLLSFIENENMEEAT